jgi:hypothetical protein
MAAQEAAATQEAEQALVIHMEVGEVLTTLVPTRLKL